MHQPKKLCMLSLEGGKSAYAASVLLFLHFKIASYEGGYEGSSKKSYS